MLKESEYKCLKVFMQERQKRSRYDQNDKAFSGFNRSNCLNSLFHAWTKLQVYDDCFAG